jgi:hypothetical protein
MHNVKVHARRDPLQPKYVPTIDENITGNQPMNPTLPPGKHKFVDNVGQQYCRVFIHGDGFCGFKSLAHCLTGDVANYHSIIQDCLNVMTNCIDLFHERTNFAARHSVNATSDKLKATAFQKMVLTATVGVKMHIWLQ